MNIKDLQEEMLKMNQVEVSTVHRFAEGIYSREITIPEGVCLVGAKHRTQHMFIVSKGNCLFNQGVEIEAPYQGVTEIGTKRAIMALTETVMTTFHVTDETDIEEIERTIIEDEGLKIQNNSSRRLA